MVAMADPTDTWEVVCEVTVVTEGATEEDITNFKIISLQKHSGQRTNKTNEIRSIWLRMFSHRIKVIFITQINQNSLEFMFA